MLERPINELCGRADDTYRKTSRRDVTDPASDGIRRPPWAAPDPAARMADDAGLALRAAAMHAGEYEAFQRIVVTLRQQAPDVAEALGLRA